MVRLLMLLSKLWSPSTRRAWIEMQTHKKDVYGRVVALHPEGVDRNIVT